MTILMAKTGGANTRDAEDRPQLGRNFAVAGIAEGKQGEEHPAAQADAHRKEMELTWKGSQIPAIVRPMQYSLSLSSSTIPIPKQTVPFYLGNMPSNSFPPSDLPLIILMPSSHKVAAIPLKPSSGIVRVNPTLLSPNR